MSICLYKQIQNQRLTHNQGSQTLCMHAINHLMRWTQFLIPTDLQKCLIKQKYTLKNCSSQSVLRIIQTNIFEMFTKAIWMSNNITNQRHHGSVSKSKYLRLIFSLYFYYLLKSCWHYVYSCLFSQNRSIWTRPLVYFYWKQHEYCRIPVLVAT